MLIRHDIWRKSTARRHAAIPSLAPPTVKPDGTPLTKIGQLAIEDVDAVDAAGITTRTRAALAIQRRRARAELATREGDVYRSA